MNISDMQCKLATWSEANAGRRFNRLLRLIAQPSWLMAAAERTLKSPGARTPGIDGETRDRLLGDIGVVVIELRTALLDGSYRPLPVRRIYIPKQNGKLRPLGIPTLRDRIVQRAMVMAMEPIWESDFHRDSYGFRPGRSAHHAIRATALSLTDTLNGRRTKGRWIVEGDLQSYFDTVHHKVLVRAVKRRVDDRRFVALLWRFLRAGHIDKQLFRVTTEGVPQGGVISPLLSNILLHEFDSYLEEKYLSYRARYLRKGWNASIRNCTPIAIHEKREWRPSVSYVRYADDFLLIVKGTRAHAEALRVEVDAFLRDRLRLTLNMEKTYVTHVNDGFEFLGHRIVRKRSGRGHMRPVTGIPRAKLRRFTVELSQMLSRDYSVDTVKMIERLNQKLVGWTAFYRNAMYTARSYQNVDTVVFWKFAHWLGRKHRGRIRQMLRRWYGPHGPGGVRTWAIHQTVDGQRRTVALRKCVGSKKHRYVLNKPARNPYLGLIPVPLRRGYADVATITRT